MDEEKAHALLDELKKVPALNDDDLIRSLRSTFVFYKNEAKKCNSKPGSVLQWHYDLMMGLREKREVDLQREQCIFCKCSLDNHRGHASHCKCHQKLDGWWNSCKVLVLLQPSSAASERVFSLLKNYWGDQQYRAYSDIIFLSLALCFNKRSLEDFNFERIPFWALLIYQYQRLQNGHGTGPEEGLWRHR